MSQDNATALGLDSLLASLNAGDEADASGAAAGIVKEASDASDTESTIADNLQTLLTKKASSKTEPTQTGEEKTMQKQAGVSLADSILAMVKQAEDNGNQVIADTSKMVAEDDARDELTPREGKTITETAKAIADRAAANGAEVVGEQVAEAAAEGDAQLDGYDPEPSDIDKQAALDELLSQGFDFEEAVSLVKEAAESITSGLQKSAAIRDLMAEGYDFDDAAELVKQACEELTKQASAEEPYTELEKAAAVNELVSQGYDVEAAVALVKEAAALPAVRQLPAVMKKKLSPKAKAAIAAGTLAVGGAAAGAALASRKKKD